MLSEDVLIPLHNGPVLTITQIIKNVISSASKAELTGLLTIAKEMVPLRQALIKMGWPKPKTPVQCDNSTTPEKILVYLIKIYQQHSSPTKDTNIDMLQLLDYLETYPDYGITYHGSDMILAGHADAAYLNVSQACSGAGSHIILSEDVPIPLHNVPVLKIAQIIKNVMSSASEDELAGLFTISK